MEDEVEIQGAEVDEGGEKPPILEDVSVFSIEKRYRDGQYLRLDIYSAKAVKELEWRKNLALDKDGRHDGGGRPVSSAGWHFKEPLFEGKLTSLAKTTSDPVTSKHGHAGVVFSNKVARSISRNGRR